MRLDINTVDDWWAEFERVRPAMVRNQMRLWDRADSWAVSRVLETFHQERQKQTAIECIRTMLERIEKEKKAETYEELIALRVLLRRTYLLKNEEAA